MNLQFLNVSKNVNNAKRSQKFKICNIYFIFYDIDCTARK